jgi:hypothetical protein
MRDGIAWLNIGIVATCSYHKNKQSAHADQN